jgi:hypothetical protein
VEPPGIASPASLSHIWHPENMLAVTDVATDGELWGGQRRNCAVPTSRECKDVGDGAKAGNSTHRSAMRLEGWPRTPWFETRCFAALLTMTVPCSLLSYAYLLTAA